MDQWSLVRDRCLWLDRRGKSNERNSARSSSVWPDRFDRRCSVVETHWSVWGRWWDAWMKWRMGCETVRRWILEVDLVDRGTHQWLDLIAQQKYRYSERIEFEPIRNHSGTVQWKVKGNRYQDHRHRHWRTTKDSREQSICSRDVQLSTKATYLLFFDGLTLSIILGYFLLAPVFLNLVKFLFFSKIIKHAIEVNSAD